MSTARKFTMIIKRLSHEIRSEKTGERGALAAGQTSETKLPKGGRGTQCSANRRA
jgi:hypothetical protein